ncbi:TetR/AcrR family transcriptional regulator [Mesobacterium pallidum]|uniref:TetR/AcrR family transcriptional regulator n=1 Tax=Mesobacterium pallidum TaxID=2872037 RepID=UPI001EE1EE0D|nr:TetR/AcrR family transcriptional regulator [Mesobacterium pallidum]
MSDIAKAVGISRQALYLHFPNRAELLVAVTRHIDEVNDIDARLAPSRAATGVARLDAYVAAWSDYIPEVQGVARALIALQDRDAEAARAWAGRLAAVRHGFEAAVQAVDDSGALRPGLAPAQAVDLLCALVSVETWTRLVQEDGWPQDVFTATMVRLARNAVCTR